MKNLLTTLMVLLIVAAAGTALAGEGMDWKFYGKLHSSMDYMSNGEEASLTMSSNTSRFGFKGGQELNENFTFIWQFESAIDMTKKGGGSLASRNTYVGLKGNFGQFRFGRHDTPFKTLGRKVEFFSDEMGDFRQMTMGWDRRVDDVVAWLSPDWSGFGIFGAFQWDQAYSDDDAYHSDVMAKAKTAYSLMAHYTTQSDNPFFIGAAIEGLSETYAELLPPVPPATDGTYGDAPMGLRVAAKYDAEKFAISGLYQNLTNYDGFWTTNTSGADVYQGTDAMTWGLEALFRAAPKWNVKGSFFMLNWDKDAADDAATTDTDESDTKASMIALGVDHVFNKQVKFYVQFLTISNGDMSPLGIAGTDDPTTGGIERMFGNGHGTWTSAYIDPVDGKAKTPMGISLGTVISF